jgi:hypothetical protein
LRKKAANPYGFMGGFIDKNGGETRTGADKNPGWFGHVSPLDARFAKKTPVSGKG